MNRRNNSDVLARVQNSPLNVEQIKANKMKICRSAWLIVCFIGTSVFIILSQLYMQRKYAPRFLVSDLRVVNTTRAYGKGTTLKTIAYKFSGKHNKFILKNSIAMGLGITTRNIPNAKEINNVKRRLPLFRELIPSFCKTLNADYSYHFFFAHDHNDAFFATPNSHQIFTKAFNESVASNCKGKAKVDIHLIECKHNGFPAWAQNDAMMAAHLANTEYHFRVNDDTLLQTYGWANAFIKQLLSYDPPNVGVTGPNHSGGNEAILTYDFTHIVHIDIFGYHYPRRFQDWFADDWVTNVYKPNRSTKMKDYHLKHTISIGQRYKLHGDAGKFLPEETAKSKVILSRWLEAVQKPIPVTIGEVRVVSMSLYGADHRYTYGAIRNAQLLPITFPGWAIRFYMEKPGDKQKYPSVPDPIVTKLRALGAEIIYIDTRLQPLPPMFWRFLVADDHQVQRFLSRDTDSRLTDREAIAIRKWMDTPAPFHCIRDHPSHANYALSGGLFGGMPGAVDWIFKKPLSSLMTGYSAAYIQDMTFLNSVAWPKIKKYVLCHDSVSCNKYEGGQPYPIKRDGLEHVGAVYTEYGDMRQIDTDILARARVVKECTTNLTVRMVLDKLHEEAKKYPPNEIGDELVPTMADRPKTTTTTTVSTTTAPNTTTISPVKMNTSRVLLVGKLPEEVKAVLERSGLTLVKSAVKCDIGGCFAEAPDKHLVDNEAKDVKAIICGSPAPVCYRFKNVAKVKILILPERYDRYIVKVPDLKEWDRFLMEDKKMRIFVLHEYDYWYLNEYVNIKSVILPTVCSKEVQKPKNVTSKEILVVLGQNASVKFTSHLLNDLKDSLVKSGLKAILQTPEGLAKNSTLMHQVKAAVYIPDSMNSEVLRTLYCSGVLTLVPSLDLLSEWHDKYKVITELASSIRMTLRSNRDHRRGSNEEYPRLSRPDNIDGLDEIRQWLKFNDAYQLQGLPQFESVSSLVEKVASKPFQEFRDKMTQVVISISKAGERRWRKVFGLAQKS